MVIDYLLLGLLGRVDQVLDAHGVAAAVSAGGGDGLFRPLGVAQRVLRAARPSRRGWV